MTTIFRGWHAPPATGQPLDSDLTAIAALTTTAAGRGLLDDADAGALRTTLGLGTAAVEAASATKTASTVAMWDAAKDLSADDLHLEAAIDFSLAATVAPTVSVGATGKAIEVSGGLAPAGNVGGAATFRGGLGNGAASGATIIGRESPTPGTYSGGGVQVQVGTQLTGDYDAGCAFMHGATQFARISQYAELPTLRFGTGLVASSLAAAGAGRIEGVSLNMVANGTNMSLDANGLAVSAPYVDITGQYTGAPNAQTFTATPTFNFNTGNHQTMAACTANVTAITASNALPGAFYTIKMLQDAGGIRTVAGWDSDFIFETGDEVLALDANVVTTWLFVAESATQIRCLLRKVTAT